MVLATTTAMNVILAVWAVAITGLALFYRYSTVDEPEVRPEFDWDWPVYETAPATLSRPGARDTEEEEFRA